ncbi:MAG: hypothetical protein IKR26_04485 [Lachnospiraceae bacterium]|nr:hypothetical protein [Lachnospiraceae bacterium]
MIEEFYNLESVDYEPPVRLIMKEIEQQIENDVHYCVQQYNIEVDRDELIKALAYDRNQYEKGFMDGVKWGRKHPEGN